MNRRQLNQAKRNQKIVAVLDAHPAEVATVPAVAEAAAEFRQRLAQVPAAVSQQLQARQGKGATQTKNDLEGALIGQVVKAANALSLLYKKTDRLGLALALHLRRSEYAKMTQPALALEAQHVAEQVAANLPALAPYGYKKAAAPLPADDEKLSAQVAAYAASLPGSRTAAGRGKVGSATVGAVFKGLAAYLDGDFRSAVELLVDAHPELYQLLREAMRIDDTGGGKKAKAAAEAAQPVG